MTFKEWWAKKVSILPEGLTNHHAEIVWHAAQEAFRERASNELEAAYAECETLNLLHGAARIGCLPVE